MVSKHLIFYNGRVREVVNDKFEADGKVHKVKRLAHPGDAILRLIHGTCITLPKTNEPGPATPLQKRYGIQQFINPFIESAYKKMTEEDAFNFDPKQAWSEDIAEHLVWHHTRFKRYPVHGTNWEYYVIDEKTPNERYIIQDNFINIYYNENNQRIPPDAESMILRYEFREIPYERVLKKPDGSEVCEHGRKMLIERGRKAHEKKLEEAGLGKMFIKKNPTDEELLKLGGKEIMPGSVIIEPIVYTLHPDREVLTVDQYEEMKSLVDNYAYKTAQKATISVSIAKGRVQETYSTEPIYLAPYLLGPNAVDDIDNPHFDLSHFQIDESGIECLPMRSDTSAAQRVMTRPGSGRTSSPLYSNVDDDFTMYCMSYIGNHSKDEYFLGPIYRRRTAIIVAGIRAMMMEEGMRLFDEIPEITMKNIEKIFVDFTSGAAKRRECVQDFVGYEQEYNNFRKCIAPVAGDTRAELSVFGSLVMSTQPSYNIKGASGAEFMHLIEGELKNANERWRTKVDARELDFESLVYEFSKYKLRLPLISMMKSLIPVGTEHYRNLVKIEKSVARLSNYYCGELKYRIAHREFSITKEEYEADVAFEEYMKKVETDYFEVENYFSNHVRSAPPGEIERIRKLVEEKKERDHRIVEREARRKAERMSRPVGKLENVYETEFVENASDYDDM